MTATTLEQELILHIQKLAAAQQQQVLAFIHTLTRPPHKNRGVALLPFAGSIDHAALTALQAAITNK